MEEYYYWNEKLIFVFRRDYTYDQPMSGKVVSIEANRFYFENDRLIRWIDQNGKTRSFSGDEYQSKQGYIARPDGNVDWLNRTRTAGDYGMAAFYESIDTIIWGRKTYEPVLQKFASHKAKAKPSKARKSQAKSSASQVKNYIFSRHPPTAFPPGVEFVSEPIKEFTKRLRSQAGKDIWMMGGAGIIGSFLDEGEIDEFIIHVIPMLIGEGIPLARPRHRSIPLELQSIKSWPDGVVRLHFVVQTHPASKTASKRGGRAKNNKQPQH